MEIEKETPEKKITSVNLNVRAVRILRRQGKNISDICNKAIIKEIEEPTIQIRPYWELDKMITESKSKIEVLQTEVITMEAERQRAYNIYQMNLKEIVNAALEELHYEDRLLDWMKIIKIVLGSAKYLNEYLQELITQDIITIKGATVTFPQQKKDFKTDKEIIEELLKTGAFSILDIERQTKLSHKVVRYNIEEIKPTEFTKPSLPSRYTLQPDFDPSTIQWFGDDSEE